MKKNKKFSTVKKETIEYLFELGTQYSNIQTEYFDNHKIQRNLFKKMIQIANKSAQQTKQETNIKSKRKQCCKKCNIIINWSKIIAEHNFKTYKCECGQKRKKFIEE